MLPSAHALLDGLVDYAGTFPPASLTLAGALAEYAQARQGPDAWLMGRLVVSVASLSDFERVAPNVMAEHETAVPWELSIILTTEPAQQLERVHGFNEQWRGKAQIASVEFGPVTVSQIAPLARAVPVGIEMFFETLIDADLDTRLHAIEGAGAAAKIRTGGVAAGVFPTPAGLVRFLSGADDAGVAFKATAGLHHALRGCYPLTYETGSETETMHGFLNLGVAAAIVRTGGTPQDAIDALVESSPEALEFGSEGLIWKGRALATAELADTRRCFFRSFGSCAFREPADELRRLQLI
jgi:hypothetical protein